MVKIHQEFSAFFTGKVRLKNSSCIENSYFILYLIIFLYLDCYILEYFTNILLATIIYIIEIIKEKTIPAINKLFLIGLLEIISHIISTIITIHCL